MLCSVISLESDTHTHTHILSLSLGLSLSHTPFRYVNETFYFFVATNRNWSCDVNTRPENKQFPTQRTVIMFRFMSVTELLALLQYLLSHAQFEMFLSALYVVLALGFPYRGSCRSSKIR